MSATPTQPGGISIAWFRIGDLRLTDHEPLHQAISSGATNIIPFFCLDNRHLNSVPDSLLHLPATGPYRLAAILEALNSLKMSLHELGSDLITSTGDTAEALQHLVTAAATDSTNTSSASSSSPPHITLHYYPCLVDFDGNLGKHFEKEVTDSFLKAAAAQGISASLQPGTLGGGGGTSLLYLPQDIAAVHSTAGAAGDNDNNNNNSNDNEKGIVNSVVELLDQKPSMTEFRKLIQSTVSVRRPLPAVATAIPPLPANLLETLQSSSCSSKNCVFKPLWCISTDEEAEADSELAWREYYVAAGAEEALKNLEKLVLNSGGRNGGNNTFSPALTHRKRIGDRIVRVQRPPISEKAVQERLDRLFLSGTSICGDADDADINGGSKNRENRLLLPPPPLMNSYRDSRMTASNGLDTSAMLSLALSLGTLSIRTLYWKTLEAMRALDNAQSNVQSANIEEEEVGMSENTSILNNDGRDPGIDDLDTWQWTEPTKKDSPGHHWLLMHLGIRDFFSYYAIKSAVLLENSENIDNISSSATKNTGISPSLRSFEASGHLGRTDLIWSTDKDFLSSWAQGNTGFPFVDASMRELAYTGWCSNRGRQNVASFLSKALTVDWRLGAEIFASLLLDHDFAVNWASWAYVAGVGADPRDRVFKTVTQGEKYDPQGEFIATWVPEVLQIEEEIGKIVAAAAAGGESSWGSPIYRHRPWEAASDMDTSTFKRHYPAPIIDPTSQIGKGPPPPPRPAVKETP